jgi:hypothetical protein
MKLVELMESEDERTSQALAAIEAYVPRFDQLSSPALIPFNAKRWALAKSWLSEVSPMTGYQWTAP